MLEIEKIKKDIAYLQRQVNCLIVKSDLESALSALPWSSEHKEETGNPYVVGTFVWKEGSIYLCTRQNDGIPVFNTDYWKLIGPGYVLAEEQSDWEATEGPAFIRNKPDIPEKTSDLTNDGEDGTHPFITLEDLPTIFNQDNISRVVKIQQVSTSEAEVLQAINLLAPYTISELENYYYKATILHTFPNSQDRLYTTIYKLVDIGKGTYGLGETQLTEDNLLKVESALTNAEDLAGSTVIDLGTNAIEGKEVYDALNEYPTPIYVANSAEAITIFLYESLNIPYVYAYVGTGGNYGTGGDTIADETNFILLEGVVPVPNLQQVVNVGKTADRIEIVGKYFQNLSIKTTYDRALLDVQVDVLDSTKLIVFGNVTEVDEVQKGMIFKLNLDGTLDETFNPGQLTFTNSEAYDLANFLQDSQGRIYIVGNLKQYNGVNVPYFARISNSGALDTAFMTSVGTGFNFYTQRVQFNYAKTKIYVTGGFTKYKGVTANRMARLNLDGTHDTTFTSKSNVGPEDHLLGLVCFQDESVLLVGGFGDFNGTTQYGGMVKLLSSGLVDPAYVNNGGMTYPPGGGSYFPRGVVPLPNGEIIIFGRLASLQGFVTQGICKVNSNGVRVTSFPSFTITGETGNFTVERGTLLADGNIFFAGDIGTVNGQDSSQGFIIDQNGNIVETFPAAEGPYDGLVAITDHNFVGAPLEYGEPPILGIKDYWPDSVITKVRGFKDTRLYFDENIRRALYESPPYEELLPDELVTKKDVTSITDDIISQLGSTKATYTAFVHAGLGNDSTAIFGNANKPFLTLNGAITALDNLGIAQAKVIEIMDNSTYYLNVQLGTLSTYIINSQMVCTVSMENNTNANAYVNASIGSNIIINLPNGTFNGSSSVAKNWAQTSSSKSSVLICKNFLVNNLGSFGHRGGLTIVAKYTTVTSGGFKTITVGDAGGLIQLGKVTTTGSGTILEPSFTGELTTLDFDSITADNALVLVSTGSTNLKVRINHGDFTNTYNTAYTYINTYNSTNYTVVSYKNVCRVTGLVRFGTINEGGLYYLTGSVQYLNSTNLFPYILESNATTKNQVVCHNLTMTCFGSFAKSTYADIVNFTPALPPIVLYNSYIEVDNVFLALSPRNSGTLVMNVPFTEFRGGSTVYCKVSPTNYIIVNGTVTGLKEVHTYGGYTSNGELQAGITKVAYIPEEGTGKFELLSNKVQNLTDHQSTDKYPSVLAVAKNFENVFKYSTQTGLLPESIGFKLTANSTTELGISSIQKSLFYNLVTTGVENAIRVFAPAIYPLAQLETATGGNVNAVPITANGLYVRYIGYNESGNIYSDVKSFLDNPSILQLGFVAVKRVAGVITFVDDTTVGARNCYSKPDLANVDTITKETVKLTSTIGLKLRTGTTQLICNAGKITGIGINWATLDNPTNAKSVHSLEVPIIDPLQFTSIDKLTSNLTEPPTNIHTAWTDVVLGVAINSSYFDTGTQLRTLLPSNKWSVKRVLIGERGKFYIQEAEHLGNTYNSLEEAKSGMVNATFSDTLVPVGTFVEVARIAFKRGVTDLTLATDAYYLPTNGGGTNSTPAITIDQDVIEGSTNAVAGGAVFQELSYKQDVLGYAPENAINKQNSLAADGTNQKYPTVTAVNAGLAGKQDSIGYTPEDAANKQNSLANDGTGTKFPTVDAVNITLGTKENANNKTSSVPGQESNTTLFPTIKGIVDWIQNNMFLFLGTKAGATVDADYVLICDSQDSYKAKYRTWAQMWNLLSTRNMSFSNKEYTPRVVTFVSGATATPDVSATDIFRLNGTLSTNITFANPTGTAPTYSKMMLFELVDNGTARQITWGSAYISTTVVLPTATVGSKWLRICLIYNPTTGNYACIGSA